MAAVDPEKAMVAKVVDEEEEEEQWSSRWSFILASIGSAIGLGNFWRFPFLAFKWGGGAFFIPYLLALFVVGIPLLQLEFALGQVFRRAAVQSFGRLGERYAGIGIGAAFIAFGIVGYYAAILGWGNVMLVKSFGDMPWSIEGATGSDVIGIPSGHFYSDLLNLAADPYSSQISELAWPVLLGSLFQWLCVFFILIKGQAFISKAVWVTVLLPVVTMLILLIVGATLPGASTGIKAYIGTWDMSLLSNGQMWSEAFGQIFFSLSLATGVMTAYSSMNPRNQNVVQDAFIVALSNSLFSFLSGFAVFTVVGYLSEESGISIATLASEGLLGGPSLAFIAYPSGLSLVPGAGANVLTVIFFLTFFMLGIDSAFSLVESVVLNMRETKLFSRFSRRQLTTGVIVVAACFTFLYCMDIGLFLLDTADFYVSTCGLPVIGFLEAFVAGWVYKKDEVAERAGKTATSVHFYSFWLGTALFTGLSLGLPYTDLSSGAVVGISIAVAAICIFGGLAASVSLAEGSTPKESAYLVCMSGPMTLVEELNATITNGAESNWRFNALWAFAVKYIISPLLLFLVFLNVESLAANEGYGGYKISYQLFGTALLLSVVACWAIGYIKPDLMADPKLAN